MEKQSSDSVPAEIGGHGISKKHISNEKLAKTALFSVSGFVIAIIVNLIFPQKAEILISAKLGFGDGHPLTFPDINRAYLIVLVGLIVLYLGGAIVAYFFSERRDKYAARAKFRFACGIVLGLWDIFGTKYLALPQPFFPGPQKIIEPFISEPQFLLSNTLYSLRLFAVGFLIGVILGVTTGILIGWFSKIYYWLYPILKITGVIPAIAWMPFALTAIPHFLPSFMQSDKLFWSAVFLIVICAWFPVASLTAQGIQSTPRSLFEVARTLGAKTRHLVFRIAIPHAMPQIFMGISTANAFAFTTLVMAEMMGQPGGLGYYINIAKVWSAYYKVFAAILLMAIAFSAIMWAMGLLQKRVLRWQKGLVK